MFEPAAHWQAKFFQADQAPKSAHPAVIRQGPLPTHLPMRFAGVGHEKVETGIFCNIRDSQSRKCIHGLRMRFIFRCSSSNQAVRNVIDHTWKKNLIFGNIEEESRSGHETSENSFSQRLSRLLLQNRTCERHQSDCSKQQCCFSRPIETEKSHSFIGMDMKRGVRNSVHGVSGIPDGDGFVFKYGVHGNILNRIRTDTVMTAHAPRIASPSAIVNVMLSSATTASTPYPLTIIAAVVRSARKKAF